MSYMQRRLEATHKLLEQREQQLKSHIVRMHDALDERDDLRRAINEHRQATLFVPESELMVGRIRPWDEALWNALDGDA